MYLFLCDTISYGDLLITFLIDENLSNFKALQDWMTQITAKLDTEDYNRYISRQPEAFLKQVINNLNLLHQR